MINKPIQNPPNAPYLDWIKSGTKKYEGRLKSKIIEWDLSIGSHIKFYDQNNPDSWVEVVVTSLPLFNDFGEAHDNLGNQLLPVPRSEVVSLYNGLFHYPNEDSSNNESASQMIKDKGVVAIGFDLIDTNDNHNKILSNDKSSFQKIIHLIFMYIYQSIILILYGLGIISKEHYNKWIYLI
jgi:ASC-1-like (ASCH) protein